jgi:heme-degrading monooxygenase HmoA
MHVLIAAYHLRGASPAEYAELCEQLAPAFAAVPGLVSMTWLANDMTGAYGGFYVFESKAAFDAFVSSELFATLSTHRSLADVVTSDFSIAPVPSSITRGWVAGSIEAQRA